jgi:hypothetical protein
MVQNDSYQVNGLNITCRFSFINNINCTTLSGCDGDVLSKVLRGNPDIKQEKHPSKYDKSLPEIEKKMRSHGLNITCRFSFINYLCLVYFYHYLSS